MSFTFKRGEPNECLMPYAPKFHELTARTLREDLDSASMLFGEGGTAQVWRGRALSSALRAAYVENCYANGVHA